MLILRSLMFVPGNQERKLGKASLVPADALILDLEDSVPPAEKDSARKIVATALKGLISQGQKVFVRINTLTTQNAIPDIKSVVTERTSGICLPKSETEDDIRRADTLLTEAEKAVGLTAGSVSIIALVETPKGIINALEIASASPRIIGITFGAEDYALEMGIKRTKEGSEIYYPRALLAVACHAAKVLAIDCVYTDVRDNEGLINETMTAKQIGFQGKLVIHPDQVEPVNQAFSPSEEEITQARRVVQAFEEAVKQGLASTSLDGRMIDSPVAERARQVLSLAEAISGKEKAASQSQ